MTSKKAVDAKRATIPRRSEHSRAFEKDWDRCNRGGRFDMPGLKTVMLLLVANDGPLPAQYKDHALTGKLEGYRDCHIHGDFLLLYRIEGKGAGQTIVFERVGTHSEIFG